MFRKILTFVWIAFLCAGFQASALVKGKQTPESADKLLITYMGKGLVYFWDLGVSEGVAQWLSTQKKPKELYFAGNSSGSIIAAYYACWGLDVQSVIRGTPVGRMPDVKELGLPPESRLFKMLMGFGAEAQFSALRTTINQVVYRDGIPCPLDKPLLLGAAKGKILDNTVPAATFITKRGYSAVNQTRGVSRFDLKSLQVVSLPDLKPLGKPCVWFATQSMAEQVLEKIPAAERFCDLELIKTPEDLKFAIYATLAEPALFPRLTPYSLEMIQLADQVDHPWRRSLLAEKLLVDGNYFIGGFATPALGAREMKRVFPDSYSIGTGLAGFPLKVNEALFNWTGFDVNETLVDAKRDLDLEVWYANFQKHFGRNIWWTTKEHIDRGIAEGRKRAIDCLAKPEMCAPVPLEADL